MFPRCRRSCHTGGDCEACPRRLCSRSLFAPLCDRWSVPRPFNRSISGGGWSHSFRYIAVQFVDDSSLWTFRTFTDISNGDLDPVGKFSCRWFKARHLLLPGSVGLPNVQLYHCPAGVSCQVQMPILLSELRYSLPSILLQGEHGMAAAMAFHSGGRCLTQLSGTKRPARDLDLGTPGLDDRLVQPRIFALLSGCRQATTAQTFIDYRAFPFGDDHRWRPQAVR